MAPTSIYYIPAAVDAMVAETLHREAVGGMWEEIGQLQFNFLREQNLRPASRLIDIGCGCLRGGVLFVAFLDSGNYFGVDISQSLLDVGYNVELTKLGLETKLPRSNLLASAEFEFSRLPTGFDFALAQSVFTHLPANHLQMCLSRLRPSMRPEGRFYATFFLAPDDHPIGDPYTHANGVTSFDHQDPYHYRAWQIQNFTAGLPWEAEIIGEWGHPRNQQMVLFRPLA